MNFIKKYIYIFLISMFLCFALVPKLVRRTGIGTEYWNVGTVTTLLVSIH